MNKKTKTCLFVLLLFFIVSTCSSISLIFGIYIEKNQSQENNKATVEIEEQPVYYNQTSPIRYIDEDINPDTFNTLLNSSEIHFKFEYDTDQDEDKYTKYINFILVNLENQYSRLSVKFDTTISEKISVILTDDLDMFQEDLNLIIDNSGIVPYSAFALGNELIEIYINPLYTADKFDIAQTCSHELVHIFQYQINNSIALNDPNWASAHWFIEGMAEGFMYISISSFPRAKAEYGTIPELSIIKLRSS